MSKALLQIELNEFNPTFLSRQAKVKSLKNISRVLAFNHSTTSTEDKIEHQGLDPWVQWVNIHTGKTSAEHGVLRLGDTERQRSCCKQSWQCASDSGHDWAVWGVMNAPSGSLDRCVAFMPDPWSFAETASSPRLNDLLALPRYMARNYTDHSPAAFARNFARFLRAYAHPRYWPVLVRFTTTAIPILLLRSRSVHTLTSLLDYLSALEFARIRANERPTLSIIFLNHIAHLQHQFWQEGDKQHPEMEIGLKLCDKALGALLSTVRNEEAVIVINGLRQKNVSSQGFHVYRQTNPLMATQALIGTNDVSGQWKIEQLMTNDAHIRFENSSDADRAESLLRETSLGRSQKLLFVERLDAHNLFYQIAIEGRVTPATSVTNSFTSFDFTDQFELVCERTGAHVQQGDIFSDSIDFPRSLGNHEVYNHTLRHLGVIESEAVK